MVILTTIGRVRDWSSLRELHRASLARQARAAGASSLQIYRDVSDASRLLIVASCRDQEAAYELSSLVDGGVGALIESCKPTCQVWEAIEYGELE